MPFTVWHYEIDTIPHFSVPRATAGGAAVTTLRIPLGVWSQAAAAYNVIAEVTIDQQAPFRVGFDLSNPNGYVRALTPNVIAAVRANDARAARWYLEMESRFAAGNQYYEAVINAVPVTAKVRYSLKVLPMNQASVQLGPYTCYATVPRFSYSDIFFMSDGGAQIDEGCVLYYVADAEFHYFRIDLVDIATTRIDCVLEVDGLRFSLADTPFAPELLPWLPDIDPFADSVTISVPRALVNDPPVVRWRGATVDVTAKTNVGRTRMMFIHYCMQGLNDLFELPNKGYSPPRTYMQTTMRDERATYSSRPNSHEGVVPDGYAYTLDAHRAYDIHYLWTFNGGVLILMTQDCAPDVAQIRSDIARGVMDPTIAGFGGHRLPYYQAQTNQYAIQFGIDAVTNVFGSCNRVYYLDQRLYKQLANISGPLVQCGVQYIVVDGSTGYYPYRHLIRPNANAGNSYLDDQYLWKDQSTGLYLLFITDELREKMVGSSDDEMNRGKLAIDLRRKFLYFAANPLVRARHLLIYSDDADKASGNGWFDGDYSGVEIRFKDKYHASLEWIAAHPWIQAVTSADLDPARECVGTIDMQTAVCPSVDPGGVETVDVYGKQIHFDAWYDNWKSFRAVWTDQTFEELSQAVEYAIVDWPAACRNELYALAQMHFAMFLHESQWNKQPLEMLGGRNANQRADVIEPEDFVIAASLQIRNAQVFLNASVWAQWALGTADAATYVDGGPVLQQLAAIRYAVAGPRDGRYLNRAIVPDSLRWDKDNLPNVILYNRQVLVVIDLNGGRVTHVFAVVNGNPCCLSGTFKCYQFLTGEKLHGDNVLCDGEVLQNTVYTPNHSYIACDVLQAAGVMGTKFNPKSTANANLDCYYPDNFNTYDVLGKGASYVDLKYSNTGNAPATMDIATFRSLLASDRMDRMAGGSGVVHHPYPEFTKRISLANRVVSVQYWGAQPGHTVANEFCVDLYRAALYGDAIVRRALSPTNIELSGTRGSSVNLQLGPNCTFTPETDGGTANLHLHRAISDCLDIVCSQGADFSYQFQV